MKKTSRYSYTVRQSDSQVRHFTDFRETFLIGDELAK